MTCFFFNVRQVLLTKLNTQALLQLPPRHGGNPFIEAIQLILHQRLEVCTHITNFIKAGNNNNTTWTPAVKNWHYMKSTKMYGQGSKTCWGSASSMLLMKTSTSLNEMVRISWRMRSTNAAVALNSQGALLQSHLSEYGWIPEWCRGLL